MQCSAAPRRAEKAEQRQTQTTHFRRTTRPPTPLPLTFCRSPTRLAGRAYWTGRPPSSFRESHKTSYASRHHLLVLFPPNPFLLHHQHHRPSVLTDVRPHCPFPPVLALTIAFTDTVTPFGSIPLLRPLVAIVFFFAWQNCFALPPRLVEHTRPLTAPTRIDTAQHSSSPQHWTLPSPSDPPSYDSREAPVDSRRGGPPAAVVTGHLLEPPTSSLSSPLRLTRPLIATIVHSLPAPSRAPFIHLISLHPDPRSLARPPPQ